MESEIYKMIYKKDKYINNTGILGKDFIKNNRNKVKISINNKKYNFKEIIDINKNKEDK